MTEPQSRNCQIIKSGMSRGQIINHNWPSQPGLALVRDRGKTNSRDEEEDYTIAIFYYHPETDTVIGRKCSYVKL